jgi:quinol monooxygenase YgiN
MTDARVAAAEASTLSLLPVFVAKPEHSTELLEQLKVLQRASRADPGCIAYRVFRDMDQADRFVLVEEWSDHAALEAHNAQPHVVRFVAAVGDLLVEPFEVRRLAPVS